MKQKTFNIKFLLFPLMLLYALGLWVHKILYKLNIKKSLELPGRTISVGNIVAGGTGKSPFVIALVKYLIMNNQLPVILTRGYKSGLTSKQGVLLLNGEIIDSFGGDLKNFHADEAMMQSRKLKNIPILVSAQRKTAAQWYLEKNEKIPTHWILDDGFQHWAIKRDLDFVLLDAKNPFGGGFLLPVGYLREPITALKRADALFFTRSSENLPTQVYLDYLRKETSVPVFNLKFINHWPQNVMNQQLLEVKANDLMLVAAIANPERLKYQLESMGLQFKSCFFLADHSTFNIDNISNALQGISSIITTAKDYWREPEVFGQIVKNNSVQVYITELEIADMELALSSLQIY